MGAMRAHRRKLIPNWRKQSRGQREGRGRCWKWREIIPGQRNIMGKRCWNESGRRREMTVYLNKLNNKWYGWRRGELVEIRRDHHIMQGLSMRHAWRTELGDSTLGNTSHHDLSGIFFHMCDSLFEHFIVSFPLSKGSDDSSLPVIPLSVQIRNILGQGWGNFRVCEQQIRPISICLTLWEFWTWEQLKERVGTFGSIHV